MFKKKRFISFTIFLIGLSIISSIITYKIVIDRTTKKTVLTSDSENLNNIKKLSMSKPKEDRESQLSINEIFQNIEKVSVKKNIQLSQALDLEDKDKDIVVACFKALQKSEYSKDKFTKENFDFHSYDYEINLKSKNIVIGLYYESGYIIVNILQGKEGIKNIYKVDKKEFQDFMEILEDIYLNRLLEVILYPLPQEIYINAKDENAVYVARRKEIKNLISKFKIIEIGDQENLVGIPTRYPSYDITIKRNNYEQKFHFINEEFMIINTPIFYLYCKYDKELWDFIVDKLPQENTAKENELKFLMKSEKVVVKDLQGIYDLENHTYYNIELPRQILRSNLKRVGKSNQIVFNEDLKFVLKFYVDGQSKEVLIYNNYIVYGESLYYSKNIGENIRSSLMVP
ncbi:hypothetical protein [Paramaledivibacter caminithermalis]|jgi:hypothetical protein|uniref:Uncharacterized protein n=1 Tax=Paramaledivibacter caminithermalis (strain DSM 15212 / CIP 107654 / DViRD3) TaxID=1121301 RepID=A0A1M6QML4_PARC5|nr:hypothetical protein [Paramaledivibacter caminithermalis]SHK21313.1 hypothetical protein SAMN02745912_02634 [Paramaledivibacter caminithermalis DSM 15212]